jgi:hypothetical protein
VVVATVEWSVKFRAQATHVALRRTQVQRAPSEKAANLVARGSLLPGLSCRTLGTHPTCKESIP